MNLKQLEYFVRVAELGSFSKAAMVLEIAQPALSRQVRQLETDLSATLLIRTGRGVALTEAGSRLFEHAIGILHSVTRAAEDLESARSEPSGRIVIGLPPSIGRRLIVPLAEGFRSTLPKARLAVVEGLSSHIGEWIATGRVDLGLVHNPEPNPAIELSRLLDEPMGLVGPGGGGSSPIRWSELGGTPLILPERGHAMRKLLDTQAAFAEVRLKVVMEVSSIPSILDLVATGYGHAVLTGSALAAWRRAGEFSFRQLVDPSVSSTLFLAIPALKPLTPLGRRCMALLHDLVKTEIS
jgi:LysR family nitrogen assimilation transcriptional regulator